MAGKEFQSEGNMADGHWEPALGVQLLPRCDACGAPHPLARKPKMPDGECPDCGSRTGKGKEFVVKATIVGWSPRAILARLLLAIGNTIRKFARRL